MKEYKENKMEHKYELWIGWDIYSYPIMVIDDINSGDIEKAIESVGGNPVTTFTLIEVN